MLVPDVVMPGMSGVELVERLRANAPRLSVVYTSGYPAEVSAGAALIDSHTAFVQKPFGISDLTRAISRLPA